MALYCLLIILLHVFETSGAINFTSPYKGQCIRRSIGSSVNFTWKFSGNVGGIDWGLKGKAVNDFQANGVIVSLDRNGNPLPTPDQPVEYNGRVSGSRSGDSSSGQVIFTLSAITVNDARSYGCLLKKRDPLDSAQFDYIQLDVEEPTKIIHPAAANVSYNEGSPVTISCTATGTPDPDVKWIRNTQVKSYGVKKADLTLGSIGKDDAGMYTCRANNSVGSDEKHMELIVKYAAIIKRVTPLITQSWIGQTVTLKCVANGVPTPFLTWKNPDGSEIKRFTATENTVVVVMKSDQDFGRYTCEAKNVLIAAAASTVQVQQTKAPGSPTITVNIRATSITVKWTAPVEDGGSPITGYRVVILQGGTAIRNETTAVREMEVEGLIKSTIYTVKVYARNKAFYGEATQNIIKTKYEGRPEAVEITDLPSETKEATVAIIWSEPRDNGAPITQYTVYRKTVSDEYCTPRQWNKVNVITDVPLREVNITLQKGKNYEFIVTATNKFGESMKGKDKIKKLMVFGDVPSAVVFTYHVKNDKITLKWEMPSNNGAVITQYSVYQRIGNDEQWTSIGTITDNCRREYVVSEVEEGREFEFVVTATNKYGERSKKGNIKRIKVPGVSTIPTERRSGSSCHDEKKTLHAVYVTVILLLLISNFVLIYLLWRMRSRSGNCSYRGSGLRWQHHRGGEYKWVSTRHQLFHHSSLHLTLTVFIINMESKQHCRMLVEQSEIKIC